MCGIAGIVGLERLDAARLGSRLDTMARAVAHRGPDGQHSWVAPSGLCGLTHRRLAIIDLSAAADQPMFARNGRYALTFNGEIYNYLELRTALVQEGASFATGSDSEVLLEALIRWGPERALPRLIGMFAFALWDEVEHRLTLARDPAGEKPLFYCRRNKEFLFASELKALRALEPEGWSINAAAVSHYLSLGYVPHPMVMWNEAAFVPAGHWLSIEPDGAVRCAAYWQSPLRTDSTGARAATDVELRDLLADAVRLRLRADVPVGVFLSGGIDSGLITALAALSGTTQLRTFTVGFSPEFAGGSDETTAAASVAAQYGTRHEVLRLSPDISVLLERVGTTFDTPLADPACLLTYAIAEETRRHVTVVLNGEGSDEIFAGYRRHAASRWAARYGLYGHAARGMATALDMVLPMASHFRSHYALARRAVRGLALDEPRRYLAWGADSFSDEEKQKLMVSPPDSTAGRITDELTSLPATDPLRRFMALDFQMAMTDGLLPKLDLATMAHGLEGRCPFLDHRLIDLAAQYRPADLLAGGRTKAPLRRLADKLLPPEVATAPKRGFELPLIAWLKGPLRELSRDLCLQQGGIADTLLQRPAVEALLERRQPMDDDLWSRRVYSLMSLANWQHHHA